MPIPTSATNAGTQTNIANQYQVIDDSGTSAGPSGGQAAGTSGYPLCAPFTSTSIANAMNTAWIICTALQRPGRLVAFGLTPPWTIVTGGPAATAITAAPSGTSY